MKWKTISNPNYIPGKSNPLEVDIYTWVEDNDNKKFTIFI
jgi:hypothetical protein